MAHHIVKDFSIDVLGKHVWGWVGVLERGSRAKAGFSILVANRVIKGWPESWRPQEIYRPNRARMTSSTNALQVRSILDEFIVSHTKDDIQWMGEEEEVLENKLSRRVR